VNEFELDTHRSKTMQLLTLRQSGSVEEYRRSLEQLVYNIRLFGHSLSETMLTTQFLLGLRDDIRSHVEMMLAVSLAKAATLAAIQEHLLEKVQKGHRAFNVKRPFVGEKSESKTSSATTELWQAR
jgi:hypothetical protein